MINIAQSKLQNSRIEWMVANAQELPFEDSRFDHVVCQFGVMFFPEKEKSFRETYRVLKPGGKYIFNTWEAVEKNPRIDIMWQVIYEVFNNEAPDFFQKGPHSFYDRNEIEKLLQNAGFDSIRIEAVAKTPEYNQPDDLIKGFADGSPLSSYLRDKGESVQKEFRVKLQERLNEQDKLLGNTVPSLALVIEAIK